jgi:hypothetical protein
MQLATAGLFAFQSIYSVVTTLIFVNHDSMLKVLKAQGTSIPAGTDLNTVVNISIGFAIGFAILIAILGLVAALGSYLGWRWMFWAALVLFGLNTIGALSNLRYFATPDQSPYPVGGLVVSELVSLLGVALFVWLLVGAIKYGPWAMKRPGT